MKQKAIHITAKQKGPVVLITGGVHGDEYEPMLAIERLALTLKKSMVKGKVVLLPVVNISAYKKAQRTGSDKLDLARVCPGNSNGSITRQYAAWVSALIRTCDYYIDLHTGGLVLEIHPLTGYMLHSNQAVLNKQREMAKAFNLPVIWGTDANLPGRTLSVARDANIPAIYVEYGGGLKVNNKIIKAYYQGCINVLRMLGMTRPASKVTPKIKYWVEDHRNNQGHLQSKTPSPASGIFLPSVSIGEHVKVGQQWGVVKNIPAMTQHKVVSQTEGIVLFVRSQPYVNKGESLGGVLPIKKIGKTVLK